MLEQHHREALLDRLDLPPKGRRIVLDAVRNAPVRKVESRGGGNVITYYQSIKMQREIKTESRHIEFPAAVTYEHDEEILEYYPQPCRLKFEVIDNQGEVHQIDHTPDFLLLKAEAVILAEWKSEEKLQGLARRKPWRYHLDAEGRWRSPGIEQWLAERGITYLICTDTQTNPRRVSNILFLEDYLHPSADACPINVALRVEAALDAEATLFIAELLERTQCTPDDVFKLIADGQLIADIDGASLSQPNNCRVFRDHAVRDFENALTRRGRMSAITGTLDIREGARVLYNHSPYTISLVGQQQLVLTSDSGNGVNTSLKLELIEALVKSGDLVMEDLGDGPISRRGLSDFSEGELREALRRRADLQSDSLAPRTRARYQKIVSEAEIARIDVLVALVPNKRWRGNRTRRLSEEQLDAIAQVVREHYMTNRAPNFKACHNFLIAACADKNITTPSYPTFIAELKKLSRTDVDRARFGNRIAYKNAEFVFLLYVNTPVHGEFFLQLVHMDHTELDIELVCSRTGKNLGRPWLSLAVDAYTRRIVGMYLTFDPPSYRSNMMLLRDIVRRFQRLPNMIVVDNGSDFRSSNFSLFARSMDIDLRFRPAAQARHGAVLERLFGTLHSQYVHNLAGNTKATKNVREITGKFLPSRLAEWTLENLYHGINYWASEYYDQSEHATLGMSPRNASARSMASSGLRSHRIVSLTRDFLIVSCPLADRTGTRKVDRQRGIKMHDRYFYWSPEFSDPKLHGARLPVRYDPWDASTIYVEINKRWLPARCRALASLSAMTEAEREALSAEYIKRHPHTSNDEMSCQRLSEFLRTFVPEGARALDLERQAENRHLYQALGFGAASPRELLPDQPLPLVEGLYTQSPEPAPTKARAASGPVPNHPLPLDDFDTF